MTAALAVCIAANCWLLSLSLLNSLFLRSPRRDAEVAEKVK